MLGMIYNELEKLVRRKKILVVLVFMLILSGIATYAVHRNARNRARWEDPVQIRENLISQIGYVEGRLKDKNIDESERKNSESWLADLQRQIIDVESRINADPERWRIDKEQELINLKANIDSQKSDGHGIKDFYPVKSLLEGEYMLENNVRPEPAYKLNAFKVLLGVMEFMGVLFIPLLSGLMAADIISSEFHPVTIKLMLIRPVQRWKVIASKYAALVASTIGIITIGMGAVFAAGGFIFGWNGGDYPVVVGARYTFEKIAGRGMESVIPVLVEGSMHVIPQWQYTLFSLLFLLAANVAIATIAFAVSAIVRNSGIAIAFTVMSGVGSFVITRMFEYRNVMVGYFMNYVSISPIWQGYAALNARNGLVTVEFGLLVLALWALVALAISFTVFIKREVMV